MISCTKRAVFNSSLHTLNDVRVLITSVLSNFICDACTGDDILTVANRVLTEHVEALDRFSKTNPGSRVAIAPPLPRSCPDWFNAYGPGFASFLYHEVTRIGNPNIRFMAPFIAPGSFFESDGIHLNADAGLQYVNFLIGGADALFPENVNLVPAPVTIPTTSSVTPSPDLAEKVARIDAKLSRRISQDNLIFARIKEDRDMELNRAKEDRFTVSGVRLATAPPSQARERKEFFKNLFKDLVVKACPDLDPEPQVVDVIVNMRPNRGPPIFEVKLDSVSACAAFRLSASKLAKAQVDDFDGLFVTNTVNLSTRIRIDILKILAKRLTTDSELAYVQAFSSRPSLHVRERDTEFPPGEEGVPEVVATFPSRSYTFAESMAKWGHLLTPQMLAPVRRKASTAFSGCLEQYFVVLSDVDPLPEDAGDTFYTRLFPSGPRGHGRGRGRRPWRTRGGFTRSASLKRPSGFDWSSQEPTPKK